MKTPRQNKLDIITSLISLPHPLLESLPDLSSTYPLPSFWTLTKKTTSLGFRFIRYRWFISLVRYLQFALPEEKGSLHEDEEEDGDEADAEDEEEDETEPGRKKLKLNLK